MSASAHFRAQLRRSADLTAWLRRPGIGDDIRVRILDLSLAGARFELDEGLVEARTTFTLEINTAILWDPLYLRGEIVWVEPAGARSPCRVGAEFHHQEPVSLFALFELLGAVR